MSVLTDIIPPAQRKIVYAIYAVIGIVLGATQVAYASIDAGQPSWLIVALAVYAFVGGAIGVTAQQNTPPPAPEVTAPEA